MKLLVICGPTATGKSDLAVDFAKQFTGEVISADSRQVYRGLDIGSGKITKKEMRGVPHHLLDVANPQEVFSVSDFKKLANKAIAEIHTCNNFPILCGGTGFYIQAVADNLSLPEVPANEALRAELSEKSTEKLFKQLQVLDPNRALTIDPHNKVRLIRALEIVDAIGKVPEQDTPNLTPYETLFIGLDLPDEELRERIRQRILRRLDIGMVEEVATLHANNLSWERLESLGLEYRYIAQHLQGALSHEEMIELLSTKTWQFARRQRTWFRRDKRIQWFTSKDTAEISELVAAFLK